jgi:MFS family permease
METIRTLWKRDEISFGVRVLTWATSIRWIGWGFAESLIPVFLFHFAKTYASTGLLRGVYDIAFILIMPILGVLADRMRATTLILIGLSLYLVVGSGYLLAGLTGFAIWIVIARFVNGVGYALDSIGRQTYFQRHTPKEKLATVFGYFDTFANFWWCVAGLAGIFLVKFLPIHWLLFLIVPTVIVAIAVIWKWARPTDSIPVVRKSQRARIQDIAREVTTWNWKLRSFVGFGFFLSFASAIIAFFLPIQMFIEGAGYAPIIIMGIILTIPTMFGWFLGKTFDTYGPRLFAYGLVLFALLTAVLGFAHAYWIQITIAFGIGVIQELISIGKVELMTSLADPEHVGRVDGISSSISDMGSLVGPLIAGIMIDAWGNQIMYVSLALLLLALSAVLAFVVHNVTKS